MRSNSFLCAFCIVGVFAVLANGAAIPWTNTSGANAAFSWSNGDSGEALWGDPHVTVNGFEFNEMDPGFVAGEVTYPESDSIVSSMHVLIDATANEPIHELHVYEMGSYTGDPVDVSGSWGGVILTFLNPIPMQGPVIIPGNLDFTFHPDGKWEAMLDVNFADLDPFLMSGATYFNIEVTNHLHAAPATAGVASITKEYAEVYIPEPATMLIALCGGMLLIAGRKQRNNS